MKNTKLVAVIGDVHAGIGLAMEGLERIETELGRPIDQVFSVGDLSFFLQEEDWEFLTGPEKYRRPALSATLREEWARWHWPLAAIAGNHEPFNRLRNWDAAYFDSKLTYTHAGELQHSIPGLRVAGLSGIYHPENMQFMSALDVRTQKIHTPTCWEDMVKLVEEKKISRNRLTYYKEFEVEFLKKLSFTPDLLLLHDWPAQPPYIKHGYARRPEAEIVEALQPTFVCCGHHHASDGFQVGSTQVFALNIISTREKSLLHEINQGWCALFEWENDTFRFLQTTP